MPSLTEGAIRHALKRVAKSRKQESLTDGEGRGTGRPGPYPQTDADPRDLRMDGAAMAQWKTDEIQDRLLSHHDPL